IELKGDNTSLLTTKRQNECQQVGGMGNSPTRARSPNPRFPLNVVKATYGDSLHNGLKSAKKDIE
ncbi:MAG: hypothetical protein IIW09_03260, partial [Acetobacter sp.]|nr:hypothetical protein [Acetobacter sp.]